ncbi:hypothetical protein F511_17939 [Dorcoceras hygrometricum]|uniref:Uncharacterized protein n=1 Tax=Dorcoceras hygrometricum TaxID=472368 RepID=A0A2Z7ARJ6_9LAMI|nr:hypothetical protein F511_17939 [Dorcoceras hygrometricum]
MQYLNRAMHEKGYQESSVDKSTTTQLCRSHQSSSSCDLQVRRLRRPSQGSVVWNDDSGGHHIKNNVGPFRRDDSVGRSQRAKEFSSQRKSSSIYPSYSRSQSPTSPDLIAKLKSLKSVISYHPHLTTLYQILLSKQNTRFFSKRCHATKQNDVASGSRSHNRSR